MAVLDRVGQGGLPRCAHDHHAVDTSRAASSVALGHPPHAVQRIGTRSKHQLLQVGDPLVVPDLRRREDPAPQTHYVGFDLSPINGRPVQAVALRSVHHGIAVASNVSIGSYVVGHRHSTGPPGHVSDPLGPRHLPLSGQLCERAPEERPISVSCRLSATGIGFLAILFPPGDWASLAVG